MTTPSNPQSAGQPDSTPWSAGLSSAIDRPKSVEYAFLIFAISAGIGIVSTIAFSIYGYFAANTVLSIVLGAAVIAIAVAMRGGANWARITLTVLAGISLVFGLIGLSSASFVMSFFGGLGVVLMLLSIIQLVGMAAGIFFMFRPDANRFFGSH
jgi:predicted membrane channel-forming protein YqfA (hemolysin III family)